MVAYIEAYDPVTLDWIKRLNTAGSSADAATRRAYDVLVTKAKSDGWWTKQKRFNLFAAADLTGALVPFLVGGGNATETNHNFVNGDYTKAGGLVGNTSNKYLQTGWIPSTELSSNLDAHLGAVALAAPAGGATRALLGGVGATNWFLSWWITGGTLQQSKMGAATPNSSYTIAAPDTGHIVRSNTGSGTGAFYRDAVVKSGTQPSTTTGLTEVECHVFAYNSAGTATAFGGYTLGGYHMGTNLTATDVTNMYNAINTFCTALGRTLP